MSEVRRLEGEEEDSRGSGAALIGGKGNETRICNFKIPRSFTTLQTQLKPFSKL